MRARLASALRRTLQIAGERPRATLWTLLACASALLLVAIAGLAVDRVDRVADVTHGGASMVVYLGDGIDDARARSLADELAKLPGALHVELVPAAESAKRLQQALATEPSLLDGVDLASLPASVEVQLAPGVRDVIAMSPTVQALRGAPGIADVVVEDAGADRAAESASSLRVASVIGAMVLAALAIVVALAAIRLRLERTRRERAVLHLLGAGPAFSIVPTALAGTLLGIAAALVAVIALVGLLAAYGDRAAHALAGALGVVDLGTPPVTQLALLVALGATLGAIAGGLAGGSRAAT